MSLFNKSEKGSDKKEIKNRSTDSLDVNIEKVKEILKDCDDIVYKEFVVGEEQNLRFTLVYVDGMSDRNLLNLAVLETLMVEARAVTPDAPEFTDKLYELVRYGNIPASELKESEDLDAAILDILIGDAVLFIDGTATLITIGAKGWPMRGVNEPNTEAVLRGPRDGFVETFRMNTALVRRRIGESQAEAEADENREKKQNRCWYILYRRYC